MTQNSEESKVIGDLRPLCHKVQDVNACRARALRTSLEQQQQTPPAQRDPLDTPHTSELSSIDSLSRKSTVRRTSISSIAWSASEPSAPEAVASFDDAATPEKTPTGEGTVVVINEDSTLCERSAHTHLHSSIETFCSDLRKEFGALKFAVWSRHLIVLSCVVHFIFGLGVFIAIALDPEGPMPMNHHFFPMNDVRMPVGGILIALGSLIFWLEFCKSTCTEAYRPILTCVTSVVALSLFETLFAGLLGLCASALAFAAFYVQEPPEPRLVDEVKEWMSKSPSEPIPRMSRRFAFPTRPVSWFKAPFYNLRRSYLKMRAKFKVGAFVFVFVYFGLNLLLFVEAGCRHAFNFYSVCLSSTHCISNFAFSAKGFGQLLNFNCALIALPVSRTFLALFHLRLGRFSLAQYIPMGMSVWFHKFVGVMIGVFATCHMCLHYLNLANAPEDTMYVFPSWRLLWATGILMGICFAILAAAATETLRRRSFETFWVPHHLFIVFWCCLFVHGPVFYIWGSLPISVYILERLLRGRFRKKVVVSEAAFEPPNVLRLSFSGPDGKKLFSFEEGNYVKLCCPSLSELEWHPFSITSPPHLSAVTLHIKLGDPDSWTGRLKDFISQMDDTNADHNRTHTACGVPLFFVDGPYSSPCQHITEYTTVLLCATGIGITPFASVLASLTERKWHFRLTPLRVHLVWVCRRSDLDGYAWFLRDIPTLRSAFVGHLNLGRPLVLDITIHVTGNDVAPEHLRQVLTMCRCRRPVSQRIREAVKFQKAEYEEIVHERKEMLKQLRENCSRSSLKRVRMDSKPYKPLDPSDCVHVRQGRPDWNSVFCELSQRYKNNTIGVFACGPVVTQLEECCRAHSSILTRSLHGSKETTVFHLHCEQF